MGEPHEEEPREEKKNLDVKRQRSKLRTVLRFYRHYRALVYIDEIKRD